MARGKTTLGVFIRQPARVRLVLDSFGLLGVGAQPLALGPALGTLAVLVGAALIVFGQPGSFATTSTSRAGWIGFAVLAGAALPVQDAVNALLHLGLGSAPFAVGTVSFAVATLAMAAVLLSTLSPRTAPRPDLSG